MAYSHPHETYNIIDRSQYNNTNTNTGPVLFQICYTPKGEDGKVLDLNDYNTAKDTYGLPDMRVTGQAYYHVLNWLQKNGTVKMIRITAADATYANMIISLNLKITDVQKTIKEMVQKTNEDGDPLYRDANGLETTEAVNPSTGIENTPIMVEGENDLPLYYVSGEDHTETTDPSSGIPVMIKSVESAIRGTQINNLKNQSEVESAMKKLYTDGKKPNEYVFPLFAAVSNGRGVYGKAYRFRISPNKLKDRESTYRNHNFELLVNEDGVVVHGNTINMSMSPTARDYTGKSLYIQERVTRNIYPISMVTIDDYIEEAQEVMADALNDIYETDISSGLMEEIKPESVDLINMFEKGSNEVVYRNVTILPDSLDLTNLDGIGLRAGDDGAFNTSNPDRWAEINKRLIEAYSGNIDKSILDYKQLSAKVMLDANHPYQVKLAMWSLRNSIMATALHLDCNISDTVLDLEQTRSSELNMDALGISLHGQHFMTNDPYTGKRIEVTTPYALSLKLLDHWSLEGDHVPCAGVKCDVTDIIIPGTLKPVLSEADKTTLFNAQINYIEQINGRYTIATERTANITTSHMSSMANVYVVNSILRDIMNLSPVIRYMKKESAEHLEKIREVVMNNIKHYKDNKCRTLDVYVKRNLSDEEALDFEIAVTFDTRVLRQNYTLIVNR